ncbi:MAG: hypothetical protein Tsb0013_06530 [Phycisphaerales bacterium]
MTTANTAINRAVWFDIAVSDLDMAQAFYAGVLGCKVEKENYGDVTFCTIEHEDGNGGCLIEDTVNAGAASGVLLYLNADGRIREALERVKELGGEVVEDVHRIGPHGCRAIIKDCCGNRLALHSTEPA